MQHERDAKIAKMEQEMQQMRVLARQQAEKVAAEKVEKEALNKRLEQAERGKEAAVAARKAMEAEIERAKKATASTATVAAKEAEAERAKQAAAAGKYIKVGVIV
jgi:predicted  nucleic acid-binding Zn-ribbon protein